MPAHIESANDYLPYLRQYIAEGRVSLELDFDRLSRGDSPVLIEAEKTACIWGFLLGVPLLAWVAGLWAAAGWGVTMIAAYFFWARQRVRGKTRRLIMEQVLTDYRRWTALWGFGGVSLVRALPSGTNELCLAPSGNWMRFIDALLAENCHRSGDAS